MNQTNAFPYYTERMFLAQNRENVTCPVHRHLFAEWIYVEQGSMTILLENRRLVLNAGESLFCMPFQAHGFLHERPSHSRIFTFLADMAEEFSSAIRGKSPASPVFTPSPRLAEAAIDFCDDNDSLTRKAFLYPLCREILRSCRFRENGDQPETPVLQAMNYMLDHYNEPITLVSTAAALGYSSKYLSRAFSRSAGVSFTSHLNYIRCSFALRQLSAENTSVSAVAFDNGFGSIRNFNRLFKKFSGATPTAFRRGTF